ncbi:alcohol dehydrogenase catalytic domain-containing protein [Rhizorhabdus histidinilytica]|nr:alcohol dehydrogenase catalytic domain-containing protein [Sphingomonas sp. C8-2]
MTIRAILVNTAPGDPRLIFTERPMPVPGKGEVVVKVSAVSLNRRDLSFLNRQHPGRPAVPIIPCSDMAGHVAAVGSDVAGLEIGSPVISLFLPDWKDGIPLKR